MNCHFQSNLRHIFRTWADYARRELRLANAIKNVIMKSLYHKGFEHIREFSRVMDENTRKKKMIERMRRRFWKANCAYAMHVWRQTEYFQTQEMI